MKKMLMNKKLVVISDEEDPAVVKEEQKFEDYAELSDEDPGYESEGGEVEYFDKRRRVPIFKKGKACFLTRH